MAVVLFMGHTLTVNANIQKDVFDNPDCWELADAQQASFETAMLKLKKIPTHLESFLVWEAAYLGCID